MMSQFDYREIMQAQFRYGETRTVEQVLADQKARERTTTTKPDPGKPAQLSSAGPSTAALASLKDLLGGSPAKPADEE